MSKTGRRKQKSRRQPLGQHFLADRKILEGVRSFARVPDGSHVLEIGPGSGNLTEFLLRGPARLAAIEADPSLIPPLMARFEGEKGRFAVFEGDAASCDWGEWAVSAGLAPPISAVGNLPYESGTRIVRRILARPDLFCSVTALLQDEVVRRMAAPPDCREYGYLSLYCQYFAEVRPGFGVSPGAFRPPPRVRSRVVRLELRQKPLLAGDGERAFLRLIARAFSFRRKTLRNNLTSSAGGLAGDVADRLMESAGLVSGVRAEAVSLGQFTAMAEEMARAVPSFPRFRPGSPVCPDPASAGLVAPAHLEGVAPVEPRLSAPGSRAVVH